MRIITMGTRTESVMQTIKSLPISTELSEEIARAERVHAACVSETNDIFHPANAKQWLMIAFFSLAEEHHAAIILLMKTGQYDGSAFALARPFFEAAYRFHYIATFAQEDEIENVRRGEDCFPKLARIAKQVVPLTTIDWFPSYSSEEVKRLHSFTHGGFEQLLRRFVDEDNLKPSYTDDERRALLRDSTRVFASLPAVIADWGSPNDAREITGS